MVALDHSAQLALAERLDDAWPIFELPPKQQVLRSIRRIV